jgi:hypothetical protein
MSIAVDEPRHYENMHGLFVGIDDYQGHMRLSGCVGDALRLSDAFAPLLSSNKTLLNGEGTQRKILGELQKIGESAKPEDLVVFFFAGQADVIYDRYFIFPIDVVEDRRLVDVEDALPFDTILWMLGHFTCNSLIIIDSQKAAAVGFDASRFRNAKSSILVSSAPNEYAVEVDVDGVKQGAFTASIVKALRTSYREKKTLTLIELFESIYEETKRLTENRQHPILIGTLDYGLVVADPTRVRHDNPWA